MVFVWLFDDGIKKWTRDARDVKVILEKDNENSRAVDVLKHHQGLVVLRALWVKGRWKEEF